MISRLKDSGLFTLVLVVLLALAIRIPALWYLPSVGTISKPGILAPMVLGLNTWPLVSVLVSLLMVIAQAFLINEIARSHGLLKPVGYLPAYFFILMQSIYPENLLISEYHFGNFFVFIGLIYLLKLREGYSTVLLFYSSIAFGISILIVPDHLMILLFVLACVVVYKTIVIRDVLAIVFGLTLPYYVLRSLIFINGWDLSSMSNITTTPINIEVFGSGVAGLFAGYSAFAFFLFLSLFGLIRQMGTYYKDNVEVRRSKLVVILFFVYSLLLMLLHWKELKSFHLLLAFPAAIFIASFFTGEKNYWWKELLNVCLLATLIYTLY
jgi:hypothetical protein